ncbi:hypothetical protein N665_2104s0001 [Sinapis alba]|nr:hypothetical protein N665_2104s0001 [Sinapis alba]
METLFQKHHVQEEEKMSYATKTLTGPAYAWWAKEEYDIWYCDDPAHTWESFKFEMLEEFVKKGPVHELPLIFTKADWSHTSTTSSKSGSKPANQHHYPQKTEPVIVKKIVNKLESSQPSSLPSIKVPEIFPYSKGTFQPRKKEAEFVLRKDGPKTEVEALTPSLQKPPASSPIQGNFSNSKNVKIQTCYRCHKRGHFAVTCPSRKLLGSTSLDLKTEPIKSDSLVPLKLSNSGFKHLSLSKGFDPGIRQDDGRPRRGVKVKENQGQLLTCLQNVEEEGRISKRTHAAKEQIILQLAEHIWIKRCLGAKVNQEVTTSNFLIPDDPPGHAPPTISPDQNRGVLLSFLLQGEPPDVQSKIKPIKYQGKALESQKRMKPNLLYLRADNPVSRSKLFQGRGYDEAIKPNQPKIYPEQKDVNFTNWRFASPSICEGPSLEAVSSPMKKRSDPKQIMEVKMGFLAFQKARNEENRPTNQIRPEDNWPKPRHPEDQYNHYGRAAFILPWASKHRIRRIYSCPYLPNLESLAFKLQQLFSRVYGRDQHIPSSQEDSQESQLSLETVQVQDNSSSPFASQNPNDLSNGKLDWIEQASKSTISTIFPFDLHLPR